MPEPTDPADAKKRFLDATEAEIVHGPDVIADKVSAALKDADRFAVPRVKPPLSEALRQLRRDGGPAEGTVKQDALSRNAAEIDERAGSAEKLRPAETDPA